MATTAPDKRNTITRRVLAADIDTVTRVQLSDFELLQRCMTELFAKHPELVDTYEGRHLGHLTSEIDSSLLKTINDLRHVARVAYSAEPLPPVEGQPYCEREQRPVNANLFEWHLKGCFVCRDEPEGFHGTRG
jgi:hypothetical protein